VRGIGALTHSNMDKELKKIAQKDLQGVEYLNSIEKNTGVNINDDRKFVEKIQDPKFIAQGFSQNLPNLLVSLGVTAPAAVLGAPAPVIAGLGFGVAGSLEGGFAYNEAKQFGATEEEATKAATLTGLVNGMLETLPIFKVLQRSTIKNVKNKLLSNRVSNILRQGKRVGTQAISEGSTESLQEIVSNTVARIYDENRNIFQ